MKFNLRYENNELQKEGKLDEQIIADFENCLDNLLEYRIQSMRDDKHRPDDHNERMAEAEAKIKYVRRVLELVKRK